MFFIFQWDIAWNRGERSIIFHAFFLVKKCLKVKEILIQNKALFFWKKNQDTVWQYYKSVPNQLSRNVFSQTVNRNRWHISDATKNKVRKVPIFYLDQISRTLVWFFKRKSFCLHNWFRVTRQKSFKDKEINSIQSNIVTPIT